MRFLLVDRIDSLEVGKSITAVKNLSLAEEYLADHFPGFPVEPGVLMLESMVQASAWLMRFSDEFQYSTVLLKQARAVRFNSFLQPGQTLNISSVVHRREPRSYVFKATGTVDGNSTVSARLTLEQFNLSEREASLAGTDLKLTKEMQDLFALLWKSEAPAAG
ncbi:MAG: 3-hydroxyacyl-ACP dehydratase FabZ family protein [Planctomycetaceae bacterium]